MNETTTKEANEIYVVCQTPRCQQTYPLKQFNKTDRDIKCEKCGGVLIDHEGRANLSQNAAVIPVISCEELEQDHRRRRKEKREKLIELQEELRELDEEALDMYGDDEIMHDIEPKPIPTKTMHMYTCETGCGHTTIVDKFYKTKRIFCGVCGTKTTMVYKGECSVAEPTKAKLFV